MHAELGSNLFRTMKPYRQIRPAAAIAADLFKPQIERANPQADYADLLHEAWLNGTLAEVLSAKSENGRNPLLYALLREESYDAAFVFIYSCLAKMDLMPTAEELEDLKDRAASRKICRSLVKSIQRFAQLIEDLSAVQNPDSWKEFLIKHQSVENDFLRGVDRDFMDLCNYVPEDNVAHHFLQAGNPLELIGIGYMHKILKMFYNQKHAERSKDFDFKQAAQNDRYYEQLIHEAHVASGHGFNFRHALVNGLIYPLCWIQHHASPEAKANPHIAHHIMESCVGVLNNVFTGPQFFNHVTKWVESGKPGVNYDKEQQWPVLPEWRVPYIAEDGDNGPVEFGMIYIKPLKNRTETHAEDEVMYFCGINRLVDGQNGREQVLSLRWEPHPPYADRFLFRLAPENRISTAVIYVENWNAGDQQGYAVSNNSHMHHASLWDRHPSPEIRAIVDAYIEQINTGEIPVDWDAFDCARELDGSSQGFIAGVLSGQISLAPEQLMDAYKIFQPCLGKKLLIDLMFSVTGTTAGYKPEKLRPEFLYERINKAAGLPPGAWPVFIDADEWQHALEKRRAALPAPHQPHVKTIIPG